MSLPEPACAFPTLTGEFSAFVPENRLYREKIGADVRPFDAAFRNRLSARMNMDTKYHDGGDAVSAVEEYMQNREAIVCDPVNEDRDLAALAELEAERDALVEIAVMARRMWSRGYRSPVCQGARRPPCTHRWG